MSTFDIASLGSVWFFVCRQWFRIILGKIVNMNVSRTAAFMMKLYCMGRKKSALMLNIIQDFILFCDLNLSNWHRQILTKSGCSVLAVGSEISLWHCTCESCGFLVPCYHFVLGTVNNISRPVPNPFLIDHSTNEFKNERKMNDVFDFSHKKIFTLPLSNHPRLEIKKSVAGIWTWTGTFSNQVP